MAKQVWTGDGMIEEMTKRVKNGDYLPEIVEWASALLDGLSQWDRDRVVAWIEGAMTAKKRALKEELLALLEEAGYRMEE